MIQHLQKNFRYHLKREDWLKTPQNEARGYIQPQMLKELWFHTGTICNLSCPFCLEGSKPGDDRLNKIFLSDIKPFVEEALSLGVERISFTGGEPFVIKDMVAILDYCLNVKPVQILTNGTAPLIKRLKDVVQLKDKPYPLQFRISFDYPEAKKHDAGRGTGNFQLALNTLGELYSAGFQVSIARQQEKGEDVDRINQEYYAHFESVGIKEEIRIVSFPDFLVPGSMGHVPYITRHCMTQYHDEASRNQFMCNFSKMVVKKGGRMRVYACTLVDDDEDYDLGGSLKESLDVTVMMKHHRCYSCFAHGASCSEM